LIVRTLVLPWNSSCKVSHACFADVALTILKKIVSFTACWTKRAFASFCLGSFSFAV